MRNGVVWRAIVAVWRILTCQRRRPLTTAFVHAELVRLKVMTIITAGHPLLKAIEFTRNCLPGITGAGLYRQCGAIGKPEELATLSPGK